ncbi:NUC189-domain-containing protein [Viridothelium virens]|uniref:NUC189-domain-containing protein n=1 Tax=Viridothelium virens TaxID=1048519 RepID=A0A6A6HGD1_VIRVR|nr:NUC189-domain-containing protein [Viridothelium virens]
MSAPAASRKRHSSSIAAPVSSSHSPEHSRKRAKFTNDAPSVHPAHSKSSSRPKSPSEPQNGKILRAHLTNGVKGASNSNLDESHTTVVAPTNEVDNAISKEVVMISSDEESGSALSDEDEDESNEDEGTEDSQNAKESQAIAGAARDASGLQTPHSSNPVFTNGVDGEDLPETDDGAHQEVENDEDAEQDLEDAEEAAAEEPSFGDLLRAHDPDAVDVDAAFGSPGSPSQSAVHPFALSADTKALSIPSATSLTTVLAQALRTNDNDLLESCFRMNDGDSIRTTIDRLQSSLVSKLLQRIAERLHKRPGRAGNLMIWVQWSIVAHGGYLASQPEIVKQLASLDRVLRERAASLQPLLALKGKLDMLSAQLELRRSKQIATREEMEEEEEEPVIYVEGEDDDESEADEKVDKTRGQISVRSHETGEIEDPGLGESEDEENEMVNGVAENEEEDEDSENEEDLLDDEAEETDADTGDDLENADVGEDEDESGSSSSEAGETTLSGA